MIFRDNCCTVSDLECTLNLLDTLCLQGSGEELISKSAERE